MSDSLETESEVAGQLSNHKLLVMPEAAAQILSSSPATTAVVDTIIEQTSSGETIDTQTVTEAVENTETTDGRDKDGSASEADAEETLPQTAPAQQSEEDSAETADSTAVPPTQDTQVDGDRIDPQTALQQLSSMNEAKQDVTQVLNRKATLDERYPEWCSTMFDRELADAATRVSTPGEYTIQNDVSGQSRSTGEKEDFERLFSDRHEQLTRILKARFNNIVHVHEVMRDKQSFAATDATVVGVVWDMWSNENDNYFIEMESPESSEHFRAIFTDPEIRPAFETVVHDEVIAVRGHVTDDGDAIFGDEILFPDVPRRRDTTRPDKQIQAAFISDVHIGADEFYPGKWNKFVDYVRTTPEISYVFVAGDIVEGVGVYPDQDEELTVVDINDQYAMAGRMFEQLPDDIDIFVSVGNHDRVRLAEPQPTLPDQFIKYFPDNIDFVGNPATVTVAGISVLMYHGMSINAFSEDVPGVQMEEPAGAMELMLQKRHLSPIYGKNVRLSPEEDDYLVINDVPDVLHTGHVHKYGQGDYRGIKMINTATWQGQTSFQKSRGINPDAGYFSVIDLRKMDVSKKMF